MDEINQIIYYEMLAPILWYLGDIMDSVVTKDYFWRLNIRFVLMRNCDWCARDWLGYASFLI